MGRCEIESGPLVGVVCGDFWLSGKLVAGKDGLEQRVDMGIVCDVLFPSKIIRKPQAHTNVSHYYISYI